MSKQVASRRVTVPDIRALKGREKPVELFEIQEMRGTFELQRRKVDTDELSVYYPRRALSSFEGFEVLAPKSDESPASATAAVVR